MCSIALGESGLQLRERPAVGHTLDRIGPLAVHLHRKHQAAAYDFAFDKDGACTAHAMLTSQARTGELQLFAKEIREMLASLDPLPDRLAVDHCVDFQFVLHPPMLPRDTSESELFCDTILLGH